ncbi:hypothetical protein J416_07477 [Gracilibacillus halophilus YIM-C55.5]|uniref:Uncharacterized protein n=1 Tax=Gracilibacillus halophilus YIM-C55.5 TaxID=1308866 RepID=N4W9Q7_9BACI|nr:hypothetical protein [Gracilibacillus halophilus]ENH97018.1 hypothetical protein J416_07477 [Gracilibacillus halophilus YIM-C55.5]
MSVENYLKAKEIILSEDEIADFVGGRTEEIISLAEEKLGLSGRLISLRSVKVALFSSSDIVLVSIG